MNIKDSLGKAHQGAAKLTGNLSLILQKGGLTRRRIEELLALNQEVTDELTRIRDEVAPPNA